MIRTFRYSALFFLFGMSALCAAAAPVSSKSPSLAEQYLLSAANQERAAMGLQPLRRDPRLALAAIEHAREMATHQNISHQFAGEPELAERAANSGVHFSVVEENVGEAPSPLTIHQLWMHSPRHRDNLLNPSIDSAGIGVIARNGELYAVEDFAKGVASVSYEQQESAIGRLVARRGLTILSNASAISAARETCRMSTGYAGQTKPWFVMRFTSDKLDNLPGELTSRMASGRFHNAAIGACAASSDSPFTAYTLAVLLYP